VPGLTSLLCNIHYQILIWSGRRNAAVDG